MTIHLPHVGAVILTYNSSEDLSECLAGLIAQKDVALKLIVVDNASRPDERSQMEADFLAAQPEGGILSVAEANSELASRLPAVFIRNEVNAGYSAGNNIGARLAAAIACDAVLIVNPDVRISDPEYVATLAKMIFSEPSTALGCSAIRNISGAQENPMTEPSFVEEMLWPVKMIISGLSRSQQAPPSLPQKRLKVDKVSGACFMIRTDFLKQIGFFDELVFLYCEESILRSQVRAAGCDMIMDPEIEALHAHQSSTKGDPLLRFRTWSNSRRRFHSAHSGYGVLRQTMLTASRAITLGLVWTYGVLGRLRSGATRRRTEQED